MTRVKKNDVTCIMGMGHPVKRDTLDSAFFKTSFSLVLQALAGETPPASNGMTIGLANPLTGETAVRNIQPDASSDLQSLVIGRHDRADIAILSDAALSLRHAMVLVKHDDTGLPITRILDLRSALRIRDHLGIQHLSIAAKGPVALRLADTAFFALPGQFIDSSLLELPTVAFDIIPWPTPVPWIPESCLEQHLQAISKREDTTSVISVITRQKHIEDISRDLPPSSGAGLIRLQFKDKVFVHAVDAVSLRGGVFVGRYDRCDLSEKQLPMPQVISRVHALFLTIDEQVHLFDTGSTNGLSFESFPVRHLALSDRYPSTFAVMEDVTMTWIPGCAAKERHH